MDKSIIAFHVQCAIGVSALSFRKQMSAGTRLVCGKNGGYAILKPPFDGQRKFIEWKDVKDRIELMLVGDPFEWTEEGLRVLLSLSSIGCIQLYSCRLSSTTVRLMSHLLKTGVCQDIQLIGVASARYRYGNPSCVDRTAATASIARASVYDIDSNRGAAKFIAATTIVCNEQPFVPHVVTIRIRPAFV